MKWPFNIIAVLLLMLFSFSLIGCETSGYSNNGPSLALRAGLSPQQQRDSYALGYYKARGVYPPGYQPPSTNQAAQSYMIYQPSTGSWIQVSPSGNGNYNFYNQATGTYGQAILQQNGNYNTYEFGTGTHGQLINQGNGIYYYYPFNYKRR
jgi:hypothetical protein